MRDVTVEPVRAAFTATVTPPGSKSLTNRALVLAALGGGTSTLSNVLLADDTAVMIDGLQRLGFELEVDEGRRSVRVGGRGGSVPATNADLHCGNSGTTIRFLTALCTLGHGTYTLDGVERMRQRPIGALTGMLRNLGARAAHAEADGLPPVRVVADGLPGGIVRYGSEVSSQFLSAVLMVAPYARNEVRVDLDGPQTSWPYVAMTSRLMDEFGHTPELLRDQRTGDPRQIIVPRGAYAATDYAIEPDASAASYFMALAAIHEGAKVTIEGLGKRSLQGDVAFADVLHEMGAGLIFGPDFITLRGTGKLHGIDVDLLAMPDVAQTLAVVALFAEGEMRIHGLHTLRHKETDRLQALATELGKLGAEVEIDGDTLVITPPERISSAAIDTYDDHRMAMSFAIAGTRAPGITIRDAGCVSKTYPQFFDDLRRATGQ